LFISRLGLETQSRQDLFVLRNVVMSPFPTSGNHLKVLADEFKKVLEEEVKHVVSRNEPMKHNHTFIMQGIEELYLVYRPRFHNENGRHQLIVKAVIPDEFENVRNAYQEARRSEGNQGEVYTLKTEEKIFTNQIEGSTQVKVVLHGS
jgi:hypothetical protein